jgi:LacI family transcriptional regulator
LYTTGGIHKPGTASREQHYVSVLNNSLTDGVLVVASSASEFVTHGPIVAVDPHLIDPNYPSVQGMNYRGALEAVNYLLDLGHRRIGFIGGRPEIMSSGRRLKGYQDALTQAGIKIDESLILPGDFSTQTGYERALQLFSLSSPPTAIFASNDQSAIGVLQAADEIGLHIPDDLSLIGFDNISEAEYLGLTTVDQHLAEMGYVATQMLIKLVNGEELDSKVYKMSTKLIERKSCKEIKVSI